MNIQALTETYLMRYPTPTPYHAIYEFLLLQQTTCPKVETIAQVGSEFEKKATANTYPI
jgi:hypothetical protein